MLVPDFSRSFVTFFTSPAQGENIARIQIDATCRVDGWGPSGESAEFHLIAPCRSEQMYLDGQLFQMPNYEFCGIFATHELVLLRTHWTSDREAPEYAKPEERFERIAIDITTGRFEPLENDEEVVQATLDNRRLVARTELTDSVSGTRATIDYPIKTMNVRRTPPTFQVDTGPLLVPRWDAGELPAPLRFDMAHVVYWRRDRAEFVLRRPHSVGEGSCGPIAVTDYAELRFESAANSILGELA
ncbi:MAG: hypothetical protein E6R14_11085 [Thermomicrobiales bacterium]|nr:MAG: hypothetical protein E6R14_11085 [Thermomicrobiales bacterium]